MGIHRNAETFAEIVRLGVLKPHPLVDDLVDTTEPHIAPRQAKQLYPKDWGTLRTIAITRNPWDFSVAAAHHRFRLESHEPYSPVRAQQWLAKNFERCMEEKALHAPGHDFALPFQTQDEAERLAHYIRGASYATNSWFWLERDGQSIEFDTVLRFESLEQDFAQLGLSVTLPKLNHFEYKPHALAYRDYHTERTREIVAHLHAYEIERFGHNF